jgi:exopolysaccharide biosynthesis polyprenyl glycosylphosphotransferase
MALEDLILSFIVCVLVVVFGIFFKNIIETTRYHAMMQSYSSTKFSGYKVIKAIRLQKSLLTNGPQWDVLYDIANVAKGYFVKRLMDFCLAALFIVLFSPLYLLIAIIIKLDSPGAVFYKETRMGFHGKKFKIWKFRTMQSDAEKLQESLEHLNEIKDGVSFKIKNDPRITRFGKLLRRSSLDELPQMINVIRGEMSLVGPRPFNMRDVSKFADHYFFRYEVLPGITGLWQVSGRSNVVNFDRVIDLDIHYIKNWSIWLDIKILLKSVKVVLSAEGAY